MEDEIKTLQEQTDKNITKLFSGDSKKEKITKEDFLDYESIRDSGVTNMWDIRTVISLSDDLTKEKCLFIMGNYEELYKKYKDFI